MCLLGSRWWIITFRGPKSPKTPILGAWVGISTQINSNRSSDLCIRLTWNLAGSGGQQQRLRGWSRMVVKQFQDGGRPPFWKSIYRYISAKNHRILMKFCIQHSSRLRTGWTSRDQKWKSCTGRTASSRERISCLLIRSSLSSSPLSSSNTSSLFHSGLQTCRFNKSFPS